MLFNQITDGFQLIAESCQTNTLEARLTVAGGQQKVSHQHNVAKSTNKFFLLCQLGHAKQQESRNLSPLLKQSKDMTKHDTVGYIQFPFAQIPLLSCSMLHLRKGKRLMVLNLTAP